MPMFQRTRPWPLSLTGVSGNLTLVVGPSGTTLHSPMPVRQPTRGYVLQCTSGGGLPGNLPFNSIAYDLPATNIDALLGTLSSGVFTFTKEGIFQLGYAAMIEADIGGATTLTPTPIEVTGILRMGGTDITASASGMTFQMLPNFSGLVRTNDTDPVTIQVDVGGATGKTAAFATESFIKCDTSGCEFGIKADTLDGDDKQAVTLDSPQRLDATSNLEDVADYTPTGSAYGTLAGFAQIHVRRNSSGTLKIFDGATEYDPTIAVYLDVQNGDADVLAGTLSITQL